MFLVLVADFQVGLGANLYCREFEVAIVYWALEQAHYCSYFSFVQGSVSDFQLVAVQAFH